MDSNRIIELLKTDLAIPEDGIRATLNLLGNGATIPFIARYRKERTGNLDEVQIALISEKFTYHAELEERKDVIIKSIKDQACLTDELKAQILSAKKKFELEDLYLPFKPKERTRATIAKERGLEPLADMIFTQKAVREKRAEVIAGFISKEKALLTDLDVIQGALDIVIEKVSEDAKARAMIRKICSEKGVLISKARRSYEGVKTKYESYYQFAQRLKDVPSYRILAIRRGARENILSWSIDINDTEAITLLRGHFITSVQSLFRKELENAISIAYERSIKPSIEVDLFREHIGCSEHEAAEVFAKNLKNLLLESPAGERVIMGIDPGLRTGCKAAVIDRNGSLKEHHTFSLLEGAGGKSSAEEKLSELVVKYDVELIAIGNGTASKETHAFVRELVKKRALKSCVVVVSEAGASVYSASESARREFPNLDITIRSAVSIARRLQDPLAELVKIDPKSIGVGQYQHDVNQSELKRMLDRTVESCVNFVGVDLNTASRELLTYVSGVGPFAALNIITQRTLRGPFRNKGELLKVTGIGEKTFEQCAGFLKIRDGENPLDNSHIHPERYALVERMAGDINTTPKELIGNEEMVERIEPEKYISDEIGRPTIEDILEELKKPGLDPRREFSVVEFSDSVNTISDLTIGMILNGIVTNVTDFGAFIDIGVHQDGMMHISRMGRKFVEDVHEVLSVGDRLKVKVISIDTALSRIGLEMHEQAAA